MVTERAENAADTSVTTSRHLDARLLVLVVAVWLFAFVLVAG